MDERLGSRDRRVAEAADAWLSDPQDVQVYGRLVAAVRARRAYLNPTLDEGQPYDPFAALGDAGAGAADALGGSREVEPIALVPVVEQPDELLDDLADARPVLPFGSTLGGDPQAVLDRLRRPQPGRR